MGAAPSGAKPSAAASEGGSVTIRGIWYDVMDRDLAGTAATARTVAAAGGVHVTGGHGHAAAGRCAPPLLPELLQLGMNVSSSSIRRVPLVVLAAGQPAAVTRPFTPSCCMWMGIVAVSSSALPCP